MRILDAYLGQEPLDARIAAASRRTAEGDADETALAWSELAVAFALQARPAEAEAALTEAEAWAGPGVRADVMVAAALSLLEVGHFARAAAIAERARATLGRGALGADRVAMLRAVFAQALLAEDAVAEAANEAAGAVVEIERRGDEGAAALYTRWTAGAAALGAGDMASAERWVGASSDAAESGGVLAARLDVLDARIALRHGGVRALAARGSLERAISSLGPLGAARDLGIACEVMAFASAVDGIDSPSRWIIEAQRHLARAGTPRDVRALESAIRTLGRRPLLENGPDDRMGEALRRVRRGRAHVRDLLAARPGWHLATEPGRPLESLPPDEPAAGAVRDAEDLVAAALDEARGEGERMRWLLDAAVDKVREATLVVSGKGRVLSVNAAAERLLRLDRPKLVGRELRALPPLEPLARAIAESSSGTERAVALPQGDVVLRVRRVGGDRLVTLEEAQAAQRGAQQKVGSIARATFDDLVGRNRRLVACIELARRAAATDLPVLITGESGTGKELLAQAIHNASPRAGAAFVGVNVAAIPRELLESELFGYEKGAFTGAREGGRPGKFELAGTGTLLLDEIGDMPFDMQAKLLRVLQERAVQRLGGTRDVPVHARIVATTHRDLEAAVREGAFRLDLFHRMRVIHVCLPPLRERADDIPLLVEHQLRMHAARTGRPPLAVAPRVLEALRAYAWPGNVRELANAIDAMASLLDPHKMVIDELPPFLARGTSSMRITTIPGRGSEPASRDVLPFDEVERRAVENALRRCGGNVTAAARALGVAKGTLYNKMRRYGLGTPGRPSGFPAGLMPSGSVAPGANG